MKKLVLLNGLILMCLCSLTAQSQNKAAYIIPDIGAPGTNVYIELIAHADSNKAFGNNYFVNDNSLLLKPTNPTDEWKIQFSPLSISWNGRLITAHAFIHPDLTPTSWRWNDGLRIPIGLYENGNLVNSFDFYVVLPCALGDVSNINESVLGEGNLGMRSPRGAMLVDSLILGCKTYTVSTRDCDLNSEGNQGYLPFTLTAIGDIRGCSGITIISVDANQQDGGPGGGGGGGEFGDKQVGSNPNANDPNFKGGDGFTGGGIGGLNSSGIPTVSDEWSSRGGGIGSGSNDRSGTNNNNTAGASLNGVRGALRQGYEAAGGGTGHPFGTSGQGCYADDRSGGYGAGSGGAQQSSGGNGVYRTNASQTRNRDGKIVGNQYIIPLAGGNGAASGNPQGMGQRSGYGGGGGGAIAINAQNILNISVSAKGANGRLASNNNGYYGGSGSGGAIITTSKMSAIVNTIDISGGVISGNRGGDGAYRSDGFTTQVTAGSTPSFLGLVTDTTKHINGKNVRIQGRTSHYTDLYIKPQNGQWSFFTSKGGGNNWDCDIPNEFWNRPENRTDTVFYLFVVQFNSAATPDAPYIAVPQYTLSQSAANVLILRRIYPFLELVENYPVAPISICNNMANDTTIKLEIQRFWNKGEDDLTLDSIYVSELGWEYALTIESASSGEPSEIIIPLDTALVTMTYTIPANVATGIYYDTITIWHNDTLRMENNPWIIPIEIAIDRVSIELVEDDSIIDVGIIQLGSMSSKTTTIKLKNNHNVPLSFSDIICEESFSADYIFNPSSGTILPNQEIDILVTIIPKDSIGSFLDSFTILAECGEIAGHFRGEIFPEIIYAIDFGQIHSCDTNQIIYHYINQTELLSTITQIVSTGTHSNLFELTPPPNLPLEVDLNDTAEILITFKPIGATAGIKTATIIISIVMDHLLYREDTLVYKLELTGEVVGNAVAVQPSNINFGNLYTGTYYSENINIENKTTQPIRIKEGYLANQTTDFTLETDLTDINLTPNFPFIVNVSINSTSEGEKRDTLIIVVAYPNCDDTLKVPIYANEITSQAQLVEQRYNFGKITLCDEANWEFVFTNNGQNDIFVTEVIDVFGGADAKSFFRLEIPSKIPDTLHHNGVLRIPVSFVSNLNSILGNKLAYFDVRYTNNLRDTIIRVRLDGEVVRGVTSLTSNMNFGNQELGQNVRRNYELQNATDFNFIVDTAYLKRGTDFELVNNIAGRAIFSNTRLMDSVALTAASIGDKFDTLVIVINYPHCNDTLLISLSARVVEEPVPPPPPPPPPPPTSTITIRIEDHELVNPRWRDYRVPIFITSSEDSDDLEIEEITIEMERGVYHPRYATIGDRMAINTENLKYEMSIKNIQSPKLVAGRESVLVNIVGDALLGERDSSGIIITSVKLSSRFSNSIVNTLNGTFTTNICRAGGKRLVRWLDSEVGIVVEENPVNSILQVNCKVVEVGNYYIEIIDMSGHTMKIKEWNVLHDDADEFDFSFDVSTFVNGNYLVVLHGPTTKYSTQFIIAK